MNKTTKRARTVQIIGEDDFKFREKKARCTLKVTMKKSTSKCSRLSYICLYLFSWGRCSAKYVSITM